MNFVAINASCRTDDPDFFDPESDLIESEKIIIRRDLDEDLVDGINDEEFLKNDST